MYLDGLLQEQIDDLIIAINLADGDDIVDLLVDLSVLSSELTNTSIIRSAGAEYAADFAENDTTTVAKIQARIAEVNGVLHAIAVLIDQINEADDETIIGFLNDLADLTEDLDDATIEEANAEAYVADFAENDTTTAAEIQARVIAVNEA